MNMINKLYTRQEFEDKFFKAQGFQIKFNNHISRILVKDNNILNKRIPDSWTVNKVRSYLKKTVICR